MILNKEKEGCHCTVVKKNICIIIWNNLRVIKHKGEFFCSNYLHSFRTEKKLKPHEKVCKNKNICGIVMPSEKDNILKFKQYMKPDNMPYIILLTLNL